MKAATTPDGPAQNDGWRLYFFIDSCHLDSAQSIQPTPVISTHGRNLVLGGLRSLPAREMTNALYAPDGARRSSTMDYSVATLVSMTDLLPSTVISTQRCLGERLASVLALAIAPT